jgi:hypothetical protein
MGIQNEEIIMIRELPKEWTDVFADDLIREVEESSKQALVTVFHTQ